MKWVWLPHVGQLVTVALGLVVGQWAQQVHQVRIVQNLSLQQSLCQLWAGWERVHGMGREREGEGEMGREGLGKLVLTFSSSW